MKGRNREINKSECAFPSRAGRAAGWGSGMIETEPRNFLDPGTSLDDCFDHPGAEQLLVCYLVG